MPVCFLIYAGFKRKTTDCGVHLEHETGLFAARF